MCQAFKLAILLLICLQLAESQTCPDCFVTQVCGDFYWTGWFNRDRPSGSGDWETVSDAVALGGCAHPVAIECRTTTGLDWWKTGEVILFNASEGCVCKNADQPDNVCNYNYEMRELCK
jgi:hypothetical protein